MGILLMNILGFALPEAATYSPDAWRPESWGNEPIWAAAFVLIDNKMRGLFSMLFGASALMMMESVRHDGREVDGVHQHMRRMVWLLIFGLIHYYFIWAGDILTLYALIGFLLPVLIVDTARSLVKGAMLCFLMAMLLWGGIFAKGLGSVSAVHGGDASLATVSAAAEARADWGSTPAQMEQEVALYQSSYAKIFNERSIEEATQPLWLLLLFGPETLGLMLLGMAGIRSGFLTGAWPLYRYARWAGAAYAFSLLGMGGLLWWCKAWSYDPVLTASASLFSSVPFRIVMVIAHAAVIIWIAKRCADHWLIERIEAAGKVAFTNYLGTSIIMTWLFYGYGLGLFGTVSRAESYLLACVACIVMLIWSKPWLARFHQGPLEWLWRSLVTGKRQPFRR